ncbi:type III pantothenate kinase [Lutibacter sp. TH_r2]|uniref:type III pantothenate kinase n=1 Tax=Lutibacter sp. TH_r2 TaxID=3082083 RepID=UPI002954DB71|nr:type III pantothenate kinase [Lutibacter sp. TH_r2]MDV7187617.1 type III pantothenate kinase [Lutibacter sp. TH_r2]
MYLIIDVGNTRIKLAVSNGEELIHNEIITYSELEKTAFFLIEKYQISDGIISSVADIKKDVIFKIKNKIKLLTLNSKTKIPFKNKYSTPKTLGVDRIALIAAATKCYPHKNVLVIDAGTCITYDFVNSISEYYGGAISPGLNMRYKSLNYFTKKLPKLEIKFPTKLIGDSTEECIHVGVSMSVINEIDSYIDLYKEKNKDLMVVLTGGDINFLSNNLKNSIFANPNFLLLGLNSILLHNIL